MIISGSAPRRCSSPWISPLAGDVNARRAKRHWHQEYLTFLPLIDREVPAGLDIDLIVDNCASQEHAMVLARYQRFQVQLMLTHSS